MGIETSIPIFSHKEGTYVCTNKSYMVKWNHNTTGVDYVGYFK